MVELEKLGRRICIIGAGSGGKSTLAQALGKKLNLPVCHLDQLAHIPNTNWKPRDKELLWIDHQHFMAQHPEWIIEGNYSYLMKERFAQASSIIWLDMNGLGALWRYINRTLKSDQARPGNLEGANATMNVEMITNILFRAPKNKM